MCLDDGTGWVKCREDGGWKMNGGRVVVEEYCSLD